MNQLLEWLSRIFQSWKFWIVIAPWDIGVRIRLGKTAAALPPGLHFRLPFIDEIVMVNTRLRITGIPSVTLAGTTGGRTRTRAGAVGFRILDPVKSLSNYSYPDSAIAAKGQSLMSENASQEMLLQGLRVEFEQHGIAIDYAIYIQDVEVRTLKLLSASENGNVSCGSVVGPAGPNGVSYH